jgi:hypothetical protein
VDGVFGLVEKKKKTTLLYFDYSSIHHTIEAKQS